MGPTLALMHPSFSLSQHTLLAIFNQHITTVYFLLKVPSEIQRNATYFNLLTVGVIPKLTVFILATEKPGDMICLALGQPKNVVTVTQVFLKCIVSL